LYAFRHAILKGKSAIAAIRVTDIKYGEHATELERVHYFKAGSPGEYPKQY
jgi:hypothetical protein